MALESANYIAELVTTNPTGLDPAATIDDHIRNFKRAVYQTFPNAGGEVSASAGELNYLRSATGNVQVQLNLLKTGKLDSSSTAAYAFSAGGAQSAQFATSATNATSAVFASSAQAAASAVFATTATNATFSTTSGRASNADSAVFAASTSFATNATNATNASNATTATLAADSVLFGTQSPSFYTNAANMSSGILPATRLGAGSVSAPAGYYSLPGGLIIQWGVTGSVSSGATTNVSFSPAFSTLLSVTTGINSAASNGNMVITAVTSSGFTLNNQLGVSGVVYWMAFGV